MSKTTVNIEEIKAKHGEVWEVTVGDKVAYLKKPSRQVLDMAMTKARKSPTAFTEVVMQNCKVAGDEFDLQDGTVLLALAEPIDEILKNASASIKKL